jgi:esterase
MAFHLNAVEYGAGPPVAILHGLFGSSRNWGTIAQHLAATHRVISLDLRNHGVSPWADAMDYPAMAEDVVATLRDLGCRRFALLGHSLGGKTAMVTALTEASAVTRLVVVDIAPVTYQVHHLALVRAMRSLDLAGIRRRSEADTRLASGVSDAAERAFLLQNLVFNDGQPQWRVNLAAIEEALPDLAGFPALPGDPVFNGPTLFVAGALSDYLPPAAEPSIHMLFPQARIERLEGASHWVHAEQPRAFLELVAPFLAGD